MANMLATTEIVAFGMASLLMREPDIVNRFQRGVGAANG